jgi:hypothetical protein
MAKQTFTSGQVLSAAQMTSLQQTAMGGGSATAKTASYVLTAADAGCTVIMNAAGATTITVNTGLFAAGDTVFIQNIGAGVCTVTAGTATVNTAGSLALGQYEGASLYFTATGAAILNDYTQASAASGSLTLLSTTSLSGLACSGPTISSISGSYTNLLIIVQDAYTSGDHNIEFAWNTQAQTYVTLFGSNGSGGTSTASGTGGYCRPAGSSIIGATSTYFSAAININRYATTDVTKPYSFSGGFYNANWGGLSAFSGGGRHAQTAAITSFTFRTVAQTGSWNGGTIYIYGVN